MLIRWFVSVVLALTAGLACVTASAPSAPPTAKSPSAVLQLSQPTASPGTWVRLQGTGFHVAEYVEIRVTDPADAVTTIGEVIADAKGALQADVAPGPGVKNGVSLISVSGTVSDLTAAAPIDVTGGSNAESASGQPQWSLNKTADATCEQCLLVHGQAP